MKKQLAFVLAMIQVLTLVFSVLPVQAQAAVTVEPVKPVVTENEPEIVVEAEPTASQAAVNASGTVLDSGTCGENLTWTFYDDGELVISGTGAMDYYWDGQNYKPLWCSYSDSIKTVVIQSGVTDIGKYAFANCGSLESITIPDSVTSIGIKAFYKCASLESVTIPDMVTTIGWETFYQCTSLESITIPDNVTTIGASAFSNCENLQSVTIGNGVTTIGEETFYECTSLESITIPDSVTTIGASAFFNCENLQSVTIGNGVTTIGDSAFCNCARLQSITIPDSVTTIGGYSFYFCQSLTGITIPESVTTIGDFAFASCKSLTGIWVDANNPNYSSDDRGVLFNKDKTELLQAPGAIAESYTLPDSVTTIGDSAFASCKSLTSITIPESVTTIGDSAFTSCSSLTGIWVDANNPNYSSDDRGVLFNKDKTELLLAPSAIAESYTLPDSVTTIGDSAFASCKSLTSITIPESVTTIGNFAFAYCSSLGEIHFTGNAPTFGGSTWGSSVFNYVTATAYYPVNNATWTEDVRQNYGGNITWVVAETDTPEPGIVDRGNCGESLIWKLNDAGILTIYGNGAMYDFDSLSHEVPWHSYSDSIKTVVIQDGVTTIGDHAFYNCDNLESVTIPDSVTAIGYYAFGYCDLERVTIPDSVTTIDGNAFRGCRRLSSVTIGANTVTIAPDAFLECTALTGIWVDANNPNYSSDDRGVLFNKDKTELFQAPGAIAGSYTVPAGVTVISREAFYSCKQLESISIPDSVTTIGEEVFYHCEGLTSVTIGTGAASIAPGAFNYCYTLTGIWVDANNPNYSSDDRGVLFNKDKTELLQAPGAIAESYAIPGSVTTIGAWAFLACDYLTSVTIPDGVTTIDFEAFASCNNLTGITIPDSVTTIGDAAFQLCYGMTNVTLGNSVATIGDKAFWLCTALTDITFPASVTSIGEEAFSACRSLHEIHFKGNAPTIFLTAFKNVTATAFYPANNATWTEEVLLDYCGTITWLTEGTDAPEPGIVASGTCGENLTWKLSLEGVLTISGTGAMDSADGSVWYDYSESIKKVVIEDGVTTIDANAFAECYNLAQVTIPNSVTTIGEMAFGACGLTRITIPYSVTTIGDYAFYYCMRLSKVYFRGNAPTFGENPFFEITTNVYYPAGNITWTEEVRQNYGGNITWAAEEPEAGVLASGTCGENLTWTLDHEGTLTISGTGEMASYNWEGNTSPWYNLGGFIKTVIIQDGVTTVGDHAFYNCIRLESVTIPDSVTAIGYGAFANCYRLESVTIPDSVTTIGTYAFEFSGLKSVMIPASVTSIGDGPFNGCHSLTGIQVAEGNANYMNDENGVLFDKAKTTLIQAPGALSGAYVIPDSVITIGKFAFGNMEGLESVEIPDSVVTIDEYAFINCPGLQSVIIPDSVTTIGYSAFLLCTGMTELVIGNGVTTIDQFAFQDCTSLETVVIPDGVTFLGDYAFSLCANLKNVIIGKGIAKIGKTAFWECTALESIVIPGNVTEIGYAAFHTCTNLKSVIIDNGVNVIGQAAFFDCSSLESIVIPDSVTAIGNGAFNSCTSLTSISIGNGVITIGDWAFENCTGLQSVILPASVTSIGNIFYNCSGLDAVYFKGNAPTFGDRTFVGVTAVVYYPEDNATWTLAVRQNYGGTIAWNSWKSADNGIGYATGANGVTIIDYDGNTSALMLPSEIDGQPVTSIANGAFSGAEALNTVVIPSSITEVGEYAFYNCPNLETVTFVGADAGANQVYAQSNAAVTTIGSYAFAGCSGLKEIIFQGNAPTIGEAAFEGVTATAYYPADNATWTEEVRQNYGGTITWVPVGGEEPEAPEMEWVQASLSLEGNIGINFYVTLNETLVNDEGTVMRFTINGENIDVPLAAADFRDGKYIFTCPVSAKNMADDVTAQIFCSEGAVGDSRTLSVRYYAMYMINNSQNPAIVKLMKAMLNYGAAAQMSFSHNTGDLANKDLSEADKVLAEVDASAYVHSVIGSEAGIRASGITLVLETETAVRVLFTLDGSKTIDQYTFQVDGKVVQPQLRGGNVYFIEIPNIAAQDLDDIYNVTVGGLTVRYGSLSYVNQINNLAAATQLQKDMAKALFAYWNGAENYFNSL